MDPLFQTAKQMFPNASDDEINNSIAQIRQQQPNASDDEIIKAAQGMKGAIDSGEFHKGMAQESVKQKFNLGQYSPEARQKLVDANNAAASPWLAGLAGFGAGLRGGDVGAGFKGAMDASQAKTKGALDAFDKARKSRMEDFSFDRDLTKAEREDKEFLDKKDPMSDRSKAAQAMLVSDFGFDPAMAAKMSAEEVERRIPTLTAKLDRQFKEKGAALDREKFGLEKQKFEAGRTDESIARDLREREFGLREKMANSKDENEKARLKLQADEIARKREALNLGGKLTEGQKSVDKDYAKDYNDFTGGGETKATDAIQKLKDWRGKLAKEDKEFFGAGGGPIAGSLPDWARDSESLALRDNIVSVANSALKATFGGQLSDGERKALANEFYNDKLSPQQNLEILDRKIAELEGGLADQKAKAKYYEGNKGSLSGFKSQSKPAQPPKDEIKDIGGKKYRKVPGGWEEVE